MTLKMKRMLSLLMALAMVLTLSLGNQPFYAAGDGSITVNNTVSGKDYSIYKIFDLTYSGTNVSYTIDSDWVDFFGAGGAGAGYIVDTNTTGNLNPIIVGGVTKYINITDTNVAEFAMDAMAFVGTKPKDATQTATGTSVTFNNLDYGYYLVYPEGATETLEDWASLVSLTSTTPNGEVVVKGTYPTVDKKVNGANDGVSADFGQDLIYSWYTIVPDATGFSAYTFTFTDTLSPGLTLNPDSVVIKIGEDIITIDGTNVTKTATEYDAVNGTTLTVTINMMNYQDRIGDSVHITYTAALNQGAVIGVPGNSNTVELKYPNDPQDSTSTDTTTDTVKVYTGAIKVIKHKDGDETTLLQGATFVLKNSTKDKYYSQDADGNIIWVTDIAQAAKKTTGSDGIVEFKGLANGTYYLEETAAPAGYNMLTEDIEVTVNYSNQSSTVYQEAKVANKSGVVLPGTGGLGTKFFAVGGGAIIIISAFYLVKGKLKKRVAGN